MGPYSEEFARSMVVLMAKCRLAKRREGGRAGELRARLLKEFVMQVNKAELRETLTAGQQSYVDDLITDFSFQ
jgi:hypothetical protein